MFAGAKPPVSWRYLIFAHPSCGNPLPQRTGVLHSPFLGSKRLSSYCGRVGKALRTELGPLNEDGFSPSLAHEGACAETLRKGTLPIPRIEAARIERRRWAVLSTDY